MNIRNLLFTALLVLGTFPLNAQRWEVLGSLHRISTFAVQHVGGDVWLCGSLRISSTSSGRTPCSAMCSTFPSRPFPAVLQYFTTPDRRRHEVAVRV